MLEPINATPADFTPEGLVVLGDYEHFTYEFYLDGVFVKSTAGLGGGPAYNDSALDARVTALEQGGVGVPGTARDPFAAGDNPAITGAVTAAGNTWTDGDLLAYANATLQDAGAPPAEAGQNSSILVGTADVATMDEFDMRDADGFAWRYRYSRRNDGTSGWTRIAKTA